MPLVTTKKMFESAYKNGYAIGAFNVNNMEIIQGIVEAATEENAPLILQVSSGARKYANPVYLRKMVEAAEEVSHLPICLHLDHGDSFELCKSCIDGGFNSVMIDGSHLPFKENIALTKKVVEYAHDHGVTVEGELGRLAGVEDDVKVSAEDSSYTRPEEVEEFVTKTGCDSLAPYSSARRFFRSPELCQDNQRKRRQARGRNRRARRYAPQGCKHGCLQDQYRLRPAPCVHRGYQKALYGASRPLRSPSVPGRRPCEHQRDRQAQAHRSPRLRRKGRRSSLS